MVTTRTVDPHTLVLVVVDDDWANAKVHPASDIAEIERHASEATDGNVGVAFYPIAGLAGLPKLLAALKALTASAEAAAILTRRTAAWSSGSEQAQASIGAVLTDVGEARAAIAEAEGGAL